MNLRESICITLPLAQSIAKGRAAFSNPSEPDPPDPHPLLFVTWLNFLWCLNLWRLHGGLPPLHSCKCHVTSSMVVVHVRGIERTAKGRLWVIHGRDVESPRNYQVLIRSDSNGRRWSNPKLMILPREKACLRSWTRQIWPLMRSTSGSPSKLSCSTIHTL